MTKERIDELVNLINNEDIDSIIQFVGIKDTKQYSEEEFDNMIITLVAREIEQSSDEEYEYFLQLDDSIKIEIVPYFEDKDKIKDYIESNLQLNEYNKIKLVGATKDEKYIKEYIQNNPNLNKYDECKLVKATGSIEYIKQFINNNPDISVYSKIELFEACGSKDIIKQYIEENIEIEISDRIKLIGATNDTKYIKQYIKDNSDLETTYKTELVQMTKDPQYIKQYLQQNPDIRIYEKLSLLEVIGKDAIKEYIEEEELQLSDIVFLLEATKDAQYIKQYIIDNSKIDIQDKIDLLKNSGGEDIIKQYIEESPELELDDRIKLIEATESLEYISRYIEENSNLNQEDQIRLVRATSDFEYIKQYIQKNPELKLSNKISIFGSVKHKEVIKKYFEGMIEKSKVDSQIILPKDITIGIEIESENENDSNVARIDVYPENWKSKGDGSLRFGTEIVSPILNGTKQDTENIYRVCDILKVMGQKTSDRCGGHVHIGAQYLYDGGEKAITNFLTIYSNAEDLIYLIGNAEGVELRKGVMRYAKPISEKISEISKDGSIQLDTTKDVDNLIKILKKDKEVKDDDRYQGLNLTNIGSENKNTIEFRISNGTVDAKTWIENINLYGGLIASAREITEISKKIEEGKKITNEEIFKMECFNKLQETDTTQEERLEALIGLEFRTEEQRNVYRRRYEKNKEFVKEEMIDRKQPIIFKTKDIGKKILPETNIDEIENADRRIEIDVKNEITQYDRSE